MEHTRCRIVRKRVNYSRPPAIRRGASLCEITVVRNRRARVNTQLNCLARHSWPFIWYFIRARRDRNPVCPFWSHISRCDVSRRSAPATIQIETQYRIIWIYGWCVQFVARADSTTSSPDNMRNYEYITWQDCVSSRARSNFLYTSITGGSVISITLRPVESHWSDHLIVATVPITDVVCKCRQCRCTQDAVNSIAANAESWIRYGVLACCSEVWQITINRT